MCKKCSTCGDIKSIDQYSNIKKRNGNILISSKCNICRNELLKYQQEWRDNNKEHIKNHYENNKVYVLEKCKEYRENNKEKIKQFKHDYYQKEENKKNRNEKDKKRKKTDFVFRLMANMRTRVHSILKHNKKDSTNILIGCKKSELVSWIENQFIDDQSWENYGKIWHVDHVIPLAFFNLFQRFNAFTIIN